MDICYPVEEKNKEDKYKMILGSKKPIVVLNDILSDISLMDDIPLIYRIVNNKGKRTSNKKSITSNKSSQNSKIKKPRYDQKCSLIRVSKNKINKTDKIIEKLNDLNKEEFDEEKYSSSDSFKAKYFKLMKAKALEDGSKVKICLEKVVQCDKNSNVIKMRNTLKTLCKNNSISNPQNKYDLNISSSTKEINDKCKEANLQTESANFRVNYLFKKNNGKYANKIELQTKNKNSDTFTESKKVINLVHLKYNMGNENLVPNIGSVKCNSECNNELVIKTNNRNTAFPCTSQKAIEQESNLTDVAKQSLNKNTDLLKEKCTKINQSVNNNTVKKIKLCRNNWLQNNITECKNVNIHDSTSNDAFKSNIDKTLSQSITSDVSELNIVANTNEDEATQVACTQLNNDTDVSHFSEEIESSNDTVKTECDSLQNTQLSELVGSKTHKPFIENQCSLSNKINSAEEETMSDVEDSDCISLFADSSLMEEYNVEKPFHMTDDIFENYYKNIKSDFDKMYTNNINNNETNVPVKIAKLSGSKKISVSEKNSILPKKSFNNKQIWKIKTITETSKNIKDILYIFRGFCYTTLKTGVCYNRNCVYEHNFFSSLITWYKDDEQYVFQILEKLALNECTQFINNFYVLVLRYYCTYDINFLLKIFKKLCELKVINDEVAFKTIEWIQRSGHPIKLITDKLALIVNNHDFEFVNWILKILKRYIALGEYWNTVRSLFLKIDNLKPEIIEIILQECRITQTHVQDININIIRKLDNQTRSEINHEILLFFRSLLTHKGKDLTVTGSVPSQLIEIINSPNNNPSIDESTTAVNIDEYSKILNTRDTTCGTNEKDDGNDVDNENSSFTLCPIDDLPEPRSEHGRTIFWKFYLDVHSLQEGLKHDDYDHVMKILNSVKEDQQSFFTRACYQILCKEIKHSQYRLSKLISYSVQSGATAISYQILVDVAKNILVRLVEENLWVLAYMLLKDVYMILKIEIHSCKLDAATIMLLAEIYLANQQHMKAFNLLKQTNIIYTDPNKWKVQSTLKDNTIRIQIITLLLNAFNKMFPEYAFFLFKFLIVDQSSNFHPIDLTNFANRMLSKLLLRKANKLIINVAKLILRYNFTLNTTTYRALIATLVHIDMALAKKLYKIAINLGIYSRLRFYPTIYLIINCDWTKEEMYLAMLNLIEQFSSNIGHAIDHIKSRQCCIRLIFEDTQQDKLFIDSRRINQRYDKKIEDCKTLMKNVLRTQFDPPISVIQKGTDRIYKLNSVSILRYLKCNYCV